MKTLYQFQDLDEKLTELGFPQINSDSGFRIIKEVDFVKAYKAGSISFEDGIIYWEDNGTKYPGYMHLAKSYFSKYKRHPKFHLTTCKTIQEFISNGSFKERYIWSKSNKVDLIDDTTGEEYPAVILDLCKNCKSKIVEEYNDKYMGIGNTADFFDKVVKNK
jgi:hypothetical protein